MNLTYCHVKRKFIDISFIHQVHRKFASGIKHILISFMLSSLINKMMALFRQ